MSYTLLSDDELIHTFEGESRQIGLGDIDPLLCLELMRRAFVQKITAVFEAVERHYGKLFVYWVWSDPAFRSLSERWGNDLAADVLQETYANLFRAMRKLAGPDAFYQKFDHICRKFLGFVRMCIHSAIQDKWRDDRISDVLPPPSPPTAKPDEKRPHNSPPSIETIPDTVGVADDIDGFPDTLRHIRSLLTQKQWHLFYCAYVYEMRAREIAASFPELSMTARDVVVALYVIRRRLREDSGLRDMLTTPD